MAGYLSVNEQSTSVIMLQLLALGFMIPVGIKQANTLLIGREIGADNQHIGWQYFKYIMMVTGIYEII